MSLETGKHTLLAPSFSSGAFKSRPLGHGSHNRVVILPKGSTAPEWHIEKLSSGNYTITLNGKNARLEDKNLILSDKTPAFEWTVFPSAPHPPPVGRDIFSFHVPRTSPSQPQQSWSVPNPDEKPTEEVPVTIAGVASGIFIPRD